MNQAAAQRLYANMLRPAWMIEIPGCQLPEVLVVETNALVDGFGTPGYIQMTTAALNMQDCLATFAITHEMGHAVTPEILQREHLTYPPYTGGIPFAKFCELAADLIAIHMLWTTRRAAALQISTQLANLANLLGPGDSEHPSGANRTSRIRKYLYDVRQGVNPREVLSNHARFIRNTAYAQFAE